MTGPQGVQFVLSIILARLVSPEDYGVIALILVFIQIATVFIQSGFNTALIQKKESDDTDFSSIFYLSLFVALICYVVLFFAAPFIAKFYNQEILTPVIRVISLTLFFGAVNSVQNAYVSKTMQFKRFFYSSMGAVVGSGIVGVILAYMGYGVWALVAQQLINNVLICIILWFTVKWRPKLLFSFTRVKSLFSFGWKLLFTRIKKMAIVFDSIKLTSTRIVSMFSEYEIYLAISSIYPEFGVSVEIYKKRVKP